MLERLVDYHERMYDVTLVAEPIITAAVPDAGPLNATRVALGELIASHRRFVRHDMLDTILAHGGRLDVKRAGLLRTECAMLETEFASFVAQWRLHDVVARWSEYQDQATAFMWDLRSRIAHITGLGAILTKVDIELRDLG